MNPSAAEITRLINAGQLQEAADLARSACQRNPGDVGAWYLQAAVHAAMGNWQEAGDCCRQVIALSPIHPEAHYNLAIALAQQGKSDEAATVLERVLAMNPTFAEAWLALARCHRDAGHDDMALEVLERGLQVMGSSADLHVARADTLLVLGRNDAAQVGYQHALKLDPRSVAGHFGLGCAFQALGRPMDARGSFNTATALDPGHIDAHGRLGAVLAELGRWDDAVRSFEQLLALEPGHLSGLINYGVALKAAGRPDESAQAFRRALTLYPGSEQARYFAATLGSEAAPGQAPAAYVKELFDSYAGRFDEHLVRTLQYRIPELMAATLRQQLGTSAPLQAVLDLGCGTGLVGDAVRDLAHKVVGVDLSERMIQRARQKSCYDELHVAEISDFLTKLREPFDIILAADLFIYIGDIARIMERIAASLRPGGLFLFSVERHLGDAPFLLQPSGRYAHTHDYIRALASHSGLREIRASELVVRVEAGEAIPGTLFLLKAVSERVSSAV